MCTPVRPRSPWIPVDELRVVITEAFKRVNMYCIACLQHSDVELFDSTLEIPRRSLASDASARSCVLCFPAESDLSNNVEEIIIC